MLDGLPDVWKKMVLGDIVTLEYGRSLPEPSRVHGEVPVYGSNGVVGFHSEALVTEQGIVIGRKGTAGSVHVTKGPFWPIDTTYYVRPRQDLDFGWLAATLQHAKLGMLSEATGVPGLNRDNAYRQPILLPPLDEQRRIAEVLRSVDEAILMTRRVIRQQDTLWQSLAESLIWQGGAGHCESLRPLGSALVGSDYGVNVPLNSDGIGRLVLRMGNIQEGKIDLSNVKWGVVPDREAKILALDEGDILFNRTNSRDLVGKVALVREPTDCLYASYIVRLALESDSNLIVNDPVVL